MGSACFSLGTGMGPAAKTVTVSLASPKSAEPSSTGYVLPTFYYKGFLLQKAYKSALKMYIQKG